MSDRSRSKSRDRRRRAESSGSSSDAVSRSWRSRRRHRSRRSRDERRRERAPSRQGGLSPHTPAMTPPSSPTQRVEGQGPAPSESEDKSLITNLSKVVDHLSRLSQEKSPAFSLRDQDIIDFDPAVVDDVSMWAHKIDECAQVYNWRDNEICHLALNKLKGVALIWYRSLTVTPRTWAEWKLLLQNAFPPSRNLHALMTEMLAMKSISCVTLFDYAYAKLALIRKMHLNLPGPDEVNLILGGIVGNDSLKLAIKAAGITEVSHLAAYLKPFGAGEVQPGSTNTPTQSFKKRFRSSFQSRYRGTSSHSNQQESPRTNKSQIVCFLCKESGHKQFECPENKDSRKHRCAFCRNYGHAEQNCYRKNNLRSENVPTNIANKSQKKVFVVSHTTKKNKFYKTVTLNGQFQLQAFIDLGSEVSVITDDLVRKLSLQTVPLTDQVTLNAFGGGEIIARSKVQGRIEVEHIALELDLYVVNFCLPDADLIVGQNFTENETIRYERNGNLLKFYYANSSMLPLAGVNVISVGISGEPVAAEISNLISKFEDCFSDSPSDLKTIPNVEMTLTLTDSKPIVSRPYRLSEKEKCDVREVLSDLISNGIVRPSKSPFASPIVLVSKRNGGKRLCVDYRALNKILVRDSYPLPIIENLIDRLVGAKYFTTLDFLSGYHQIKMAEDSIKYTAFITPEGKYEYLKVPFGLSNAPYVFQRAVDDILGTLRFTKVLAYLDDILIPSGTVEEGLRVLEEVLAIFKHNNIVLNLGKCSFFETEIEYLGYSISSGQIQPSQHKVDAIKKFPTPENVHNVRQFLGLVGHFRKFVPEFSHKSKPLTNLLKKNAGWVWSSEQQSAFDTLRDSLISEPILTLYNPSRETILYTDASRAGLAGMLVQVSESGRECVVGYYSKHTTPTEQRYHSFELECYAIVASVKRFRHYLFGRHFRIFTDCAAVRSAMSKKDLNPRIGRWILELQEYDFEICHKAGRQMSHVDAISRNPVDSNSFCVSIISKDDWLLVVQEADPDIRAIKNILLSGDRLGNKAIFAEYDLRRGKVYRRTERGR